MDCWTGRWIDGLLYGYVDGHLSRWVDRWIKRRERGFWLQKESFLSGFIISINLEVSNLDLSVGRFWGSHFPSEWVKNPPPLHTHKPDTSQSPYLLIHCVRIGIPGYEFGMRDINVNLQPTVLESSKKYPPGCELCGAVKWLFSWWVWYGEAANIRCSRIGLNM